jgi:hypothetical protein
LGKKPCKKSADLHPKQGNLCTTQKHFYRAQQNLSLPHKIGCRSAEKNGEAEKNSPFFQYASSSDFYGMGRSE